ncbi:uncharacterized protein LOC113871613 [Abrus precatorius]|uniref:Uncharacterized protein LOC113871613 n=1 Tax=Abrus precatorius TaxID=3816 RepID=A0A8B8M7K5_ABRPR|nr:uncharacterized protein LOC113871613 [Abrus precatorius]
MKEGFLMNPKEQCQAITTQSGAVVSSPRKKNEVTNSKDESELKQEDFESEKYTMLKRGDDEENCNNKQERRGKKQKFEQACKPINEEQYKSLPFAKRVQDPRQKKQFERKLDMEKLVPLTEECIAILQKKLPQKLKDPGSFSIPCSIGNCTVGKALCDLGASINLMPLAIMKKLGIEEVKPTRITLQLADRSYTYPYAVVEDLLVKVDKFIFPADFVILDIEVDVDIPLILGRPFLAIGRALIDVQKDYRKLNDASRKDHFPLPFTDQMLERLARLDYYCFLDGYSGYNHIAVDPRDQEKTAFTYPFGVFAYRRMSFGLCNALATFQRLSS